MKLRAPLIVTGLAMLGAAIAVSTGVSPTARNPAAALRNGRMRLIRGPAVTPNNPSTRLPLNGARVSGGKSDGYHVKSASTPIVEDGVQVRRPPTP